MVLNLLQSEINFVLLYFFRRFLFREWTNNYFAINGMMVLVYKSIKNKH